MNPSGRNRQEEPPPFLGTWPRVYVFVAIYLVALIALFAWFTYANTPEAIR
ncbi:MAG: hypothetical protein JNL98_33595 [Bryobacterales bacterium]|nr:hypothetical protein [Bryobacterales bacterium]